MTKMTQTALNTAVLSAGIMLLATAAAQAAPTTTSTASSEKMGLSVGINLRAEKSAYDMDNTTSVLPSLFYDNGQVYARGSQLGGYLINDDVNEVAGFIQPGGSQFDPDDADGAMAQLDERKWSGMVGASYMRKTPVGGFRGQIATDVTGRSEGTVARLTYLARLNPGKWTIYPSAGLEWVDKNYNEYYYGISEKESAKSGLNPYKPDSSISPYVSINGTYDLNKDWDIFVGQSINYLADEQRDSPMVDDRFNFTTTVGVMYEF